MRPPIPSASFSTTARRAARGSSSPLTPGLAGRPFRLAVVGGGPAGFYSAGRLLSLPGSEETRVDLYELLPTPFGLARFGVAPDHPEVKNCEHKFEETARDSRFRFFGNVQISGTDPSSSTSPSSSTTVANLSPSPLAAQIPLDVLREHYDAVLLTYGASLDRPLGIPGEDTLLNVLSARSFVNWYNGHPYHSSLLSPLIDLSKIEHVTVIGQGNVALDVARMLLKPVDLLRAFDVPEYALAELSRSRIKRVDIVGRRGPLQLAATTKELREMMNLPGVAFEMDQGLLDDAVRQVEENPKMEGARMRKRAMGLLQSGSKTSLASADKSWSFEFLRSPRELQPSSTSSAPAPVDAIISPQTVGAVSYTLNELVAPSSPSSSFDPGHFQARATPQTTLSPTDMVFKSVGYRSIGLPGLPFDERRGTVRNIDGRVVDEHGARIEGLYTSGWLARGPTGVIATTMFDAFATADAVASDLASLPRAADRSPRPDVPIERWRGDRRVVSWEDWERIDRVERERGHDRGKLREKITSVDEMLEVLP
ncbi:hypothetical protein JCM21900_005025 [Sporobolomyces salmonicolor]